MAELHNPLFEDEKEFLERQKLEYERALRGDVDTIKAKTEKIGKIALAGAGVVGSVWLLAKIFGGKSKKNDGSRRLSASKSRKAKKRLARTTEANAISDDLGFGSAPSMTTRDRAQLAPDVYHTDTDTDGAENSARHRNEYRATPSRSAYAEDYHEPSESASTIVATTFQSFLQSDTGKLLIAQVSAVMMAYVAKKVGEYLPMAKNPDLATSPTPEPETRDIDFTYHDDDADAPQQSL